MLGRTMRSLLSPWSPTLLSAALALTACADGAAAPAGGTDAITRAVPMAPAGQPPRLFAGGGDRVAATTPADAAIAYVERLAPRWGAPAGTAALAPIATVDNHLGHIVRLAQTIDGVAVHRRELRVLVRPDGSLGAASGVVIPADIDRHGRFALTTVDAVVRAVASTHGLGPSPAALATVRGAGTDEVWFASAADAVPYVSEARVRKLWHHAGDQLEAAWVVEAYSSAAPGDPNSELWRTVISADDGAILAQTNLTTDAFGYRVWAESAGDKRPLDGPTADFSPHPTGRPGAARPGYIPPNLVTVDGLDHPAGGGASDPWLAAGATETRGNHVDAYTDINGPDGFNGNDFRASTTAAGVFDRTYDPAQGPLVSRDQQMAAITELFYTTNWLHDDWYDAGFTEAASNAQADNFGRGGIAGDRFLAEAQDSANAGARNNANMSTPGDGMSPRMQVYLWTGNSTLDLTLDPGNRMLANSGAGWGPLDYDVTGLVVAATDGTAPATDGCEPPTNNVAGKIVLVDRGTCRAQMKALIAQNAGAIGLIDANNTGTTPAALNADTTIMTPITIPAMGITLADATALRTALMAGAVTARLHRAADPDADGALDGGVVAHEYGHYIHHRLSECNTKLCGAMSEGWADFTALLMMARTGDDLAHGTYAMGAYASVGDPYYGIRRAPYSVDRTKNAFTLKYVGVANGVPTSAPTRDFGDNSEVHNAGEVWAEMMWEAYVALQGAHAGFDATRRLMERYVVDGLLMAPVDATMTETRDAILLAAFMNDPLDHDALAQGFARRGAGSCATSPARDSVDFNDVREGFDLKPNSYATPAELTVDVEDCDGDGVLDGGESATVRTTVGNNGAVDLTNVTVMLTSTTPGITVKTAPITIPSIAHYASMPVSFQVSLDAGTEPIAGDLTLTVTAADACTPTLATNTPVRLNVDDQPMASTTDTFDSHPGPWTRTGAGAEAIWTQDRETALDGEWHGTDYGATSATALESPPMTAGPGDVTIELDHAYDFELSENTNWDGGVIEVSTDAGATWQDVGAMATPGYVGAITDQSDNPLTGRDAYAGQSEGFPAKHHVTLALGTSLAGQTFKLRFLIGTDQSVAAGGWHIDDLEVTGITNQPFPSQTADAGTCPPDVIPPTDDGGCCQTGAPAGGNLAAALLVLGALRPRRRRARRAR